MIRSNADVQTDHYVLPDDGCTDRFCEAWFKKKSQRMNAVNFQKQCLLCMDPQDCQIMAVFLMFFFFLLLFDNGVEWPFIWVGVIKRKPETSYKCNGDLGFFF